MKKLKRIYTEHRVFAILMALVIVCFVLIGTILVQCFYVGGNTDKYGDRLAPTQTALRQLRIKGINKQMLIDNWVLEIRELWN